MYNDSIGLNKRGFALNDCILREEQILNRVFDSEKDALRTCDIDDLNDFVPKEYKAFSITRDSEGCMTEIMFWKDTAKTELIRHIQIDRDANGCVVGGVVIV